MDYWAKKKSKWTQKRVCWRLDLKSGLTKIKGVHGPVNGLGFGVNPITDRIPMGSWTLHLVPDHRCTGCRPPRHGIFSDRIGRNHGSSYFLVTGDDLVEIWCHRGRYLEISIGSPSLVKIWPSTWSLSNLRRRSNQKRETRRTKNNNTKKNSNGSSSLDPRWLGYDGAKSLLMNPMLESFVFHRSGGFVKWKCW